MAKYTKLFADYIESGGELPAAFDLIDGFDDLFKKYYFDKEIGFETELIFAMKLEMYADLYVQYYADKISKMANEILNLNAPARVIYETDDTTFNGGAQRGTLTELPTGATGSVPNQITANDAFTNTNGRSLNRTEHENTTNEILRRINFLNENIKPLLLQLLNEFAPCFMGVY